MEQLSESPYIDGTSLTIVHLENGKATIETVGCINHMPEKKKYIH